MSTIDYSNLCWEDLWYALKAREDRIRYLEDRLKEEEDEWQLIMNEIERRAE